MKIKTIASTTLAIGVALCSASAWADSNVALGGAVDLAGTGFADSGYWGNSNFAAPSSVTDGNFLPLNQQWNTGTVFWSGAYAADRVTITLPTPSVVTHIDLQADNNDDYSVVYQDVRGLWYELVTISPNRSYGMEMGSATFPAVTATAFAILAVGGDGYYSVSEFQAFGTPVPEAGTLALMMMGLGGLALTARHRRRK